MLLLDLLANADNNVQKASEKLTSMGYEKRDTTALRPHSRNREEQMKRERIEAEPTPPPQPRLKSNEEKQKSEWCYASSRFVHEWTHIERTLPFTPKFAVKNQLKAKYKDVAGRIITMALDSVDYSEEKACRILEIVMQDDKSITKAEDRQEVKGEATVENESLPNRAAVIGGIDQTDRNDANNCTDDRYFRSLFRLFFCNFGFHDYIDLIAQWQINAFRLQKKSACLWSTICYSHS